MKNIILITILIASQLIWMASKSRHGTDELPDRDLRFTLRTVHCENPLGFGDDDVRIDLLVPGRDPVTFKKTMSNKGATKNWDLDEPFYFNADSVVTLKLWIQGPKDKIDTLGVARIGRIEPNGACTTLIEFKGDKYEYTIKYSLEGTEALAKRSPIKTETIKGCGRLN